MPAWSGLWNNVHGQNYALITARSNLMQRVAKLFAREGGRADAELLTTLNGAAAGGSASETRKRVTAVQSTEQMNLGGARVIETQTVVNRATTSADETNYDNILTPDYSPTYPVDRGGGGGGKTNTL